MPALRASILIALAACAPRASAPRTISHPLGLSTAPGPATPPPLAIDRETTVQPVASGLLMGAPVAPAPTAPSSSAAAAPPTSPVAAPQQYTGGTRSTVVQEPNARIPATASGVASETTTGTPSGVTNTTTAEPTTPSGAPDTTGQPASTVPAGTPDVPATGVLAPPPPSEP